eukprot:TRINITY_DN6181_c0_g2_i3.p1 TRINITY_DN6181_c0_g2~~TRINITY_DN6181_c0_g2_i3.p1  ORF type:complete len:413 (+),score=123.88 TRINITY_DN6181_c0_g2_i3:108-1346(+)
MNAAIKKQISQDLLLRIERLTSEFSSAKNAADSSGNAKVFGQTAVRISPRLHGSSTSRPKTPEMNAKRQMNRGQLGEDTRCYLTEDSTAESSSKKFKGLRYSQLENGKEIESSSKCGSKTDKFATDALGIENRYPNRMKWEGNSSRELIDLLNREKEASGYLKAELQKTCLDSRKEKAELQKKIHELNKANSECYKQIANERSNSRQAWSANRILSKRFDAISLQAKILVSGLVELIDEIAQEPVDAKVMEGVRKLLVCKIEKANAIEGGMFFSEELRRVKAKKFADASQGVVKAKDKAEAELKEKDEFQPIRVEKFNSNLHKGSEVFGPVLPEITVSEIANDVEDRSSLLRTIKNLNEEFDELGEDNIALSPEGVCALPRRCPGIPANALKDLEELKVRLALNKKKFAANK